MLHEVPPTDPMRAHIREQTLHAVELMIAWKDHLLPLAFPRLFHELRIALDDARELRAR